MTTASPAPDLARLFSPFTIAHVTLRNRIVSPPHGTNFAEDGLPTERQVHYYAERARGGVAMMVTGGSIVHPLAVDSGHENLVSNPGAIDGYRRIAEAVHAHGALMVSQLSWPGRQGSSAYTRTPRRAPSPIPCPRMRETPKEIEQDEIEDLIEHYARAAAIVQAGEWDGVEIFAAQGYGLSQFISPHTNRRTDDYGGPLENRMRLLLQVVDRVRRTVGARFLVGVRMNAADFVEGGLTLDEARDVARALEASRQVDYLSVSGATNATFPLWIADMSHPRAMFAGLAGEIREVVGLPIVTVTRIKEPVLAEQILAEGKADLIGMNRALIADPELPNKAREGRLAEIRPCINANQGCLQRVIDGQPMRCTVNAAVGLERDLGRLAAAERPRRVVVVGGGPAGLEAARVAALRNHRVTLLERRDVLGGQIRLATKVAARAEFGELVAYLEREMGRLGVDVRLGAAADLATVRALDPEAVVVATGSKPLRTGFTSSLPSVEAIPGHDLPHVLTAWEVLEETAPVGERVLIVDDDPHVQATTVAEFLAERGKRATIVCRSPFVGQSIGSVNLGFLYTRLFSRGVEMLPNTWVREITPTGARGFNIYSGQEIPLGGYETVVMATGNRVVDDLYHELRATVPELEVHRAGDCLAPRKLDEAIWEGHHVGRAL